MKEYVIHKPYLQHRIKRVLAYSIVILLWGIYLWQFYIALNYVAVNTNYLKTIDALWHSFVILLGVILIPLISIALWAMYNNIRFKFKYRHSKKTKVTDIEIYQLLSADSSPVSVIKKSQVMISGYENEKICLKKASKKEIENEFIMNKKLMKNK